MTDSQKEPQHLPDTETGNNAHEAPQEAQDRGLDAQDIASQGSMITSDPASSYMGESEADLER